MTIQALVGIIALGLSILASFGAILVVLGRILQRLDTVEKAVEKHVDCGSCRPEVMARHRTTEARLKILESDQKTHSESLSELRGWFVGLKETLDGLREDFRDLANSLRTRRGSD